MDVLVDAVLEILIRILRNICSDKKETFDLVVAIDLKVRQNIVQYRLFSQFFGKYFDESVTVNNLNWRIATQELLKLLDKFICRFRAVLILGVFVIPNNRATALLYDCSVNIFAVLFHDLPNGLHPLFVVHGKELDPFFFVGLKPVATFSCNPEVVRFHQIRLEDA